MPNEERTYLSDLKLPYETKAGPQGSVLDVDIGASTVDVIWAQTGVTDDGKDVIEDGAFAKSLAERGPKSAKPRIVGLHMHEPLILLGRPRELTVTSEGKLRAVLPISQTSHGKDVLTLYHDGVIREHSIGYKAIQAYRTPDGVRHIAELALFEGSSVVWGMNKDTPFLGFKDAFESGDMTELEKKITTLEKCIGHFKNEEFAEQMTIALAQLKSAIMALEQKAQPPPLGTGTEGQPPPGNEYSSVEVKALLEAISNFNSSLRLQLK